MKLVDMNVIARLNDMRELFCDYTREDVCMRDICMYISSEKFSVELQRLVVREEKMRLKSSVVEGVVPLMEEITLLHDANVCLFLSTAIKSLFIARNSKKFLLMAEGCHEWAIKMMRLDEIKKEAVNSYSCLSKSKGEIIKSQNDLNEFKDIYGELPNSIASKATQNMEGNLEKIQTIVNEIDKIIKEVDFE